MMMAQKIEREKKKYVQLKQKKMLCRENTKAAYFI